MSITGALSNAMSGLRAAGRGAELVSTNLANALTPGYGRRVLSLSPSVIGNFGGVRVDGVNRIVDAGLASDRRLADAEQTNAQLSADFFARLEAVMGTPDDSASFTARLSAFEASLIAAASRPDAPERLSTAVLEAGQLAASLGEISSSIQDMRGLADRTIATQVDELNLALEQVANLNTQITAQQVQGGDDATLLDMRQQVVDRIGVLVPVRELPRSNGQIALYAVGGAVLVDGTAATVGFDPSNVVTPYMSLTSNTLGGLTINGQPARSDTDRGVLRGGSIGAQFEIRDELGPEAQKQIDALARDLVERFQDPSVDNSLSPADAGLFTDTGGPFDAINEVGLSSRLVLNAAVDTDQGGAAWRLRDGINAVVQGDVGNAGLLRNLSDALADPRVPASGGFGGGAFTAVNLAATYSSQITSTRANADQSLSFAAARLTELTERQLADGVDSDAEIQNLLVLEQAYAANARVIQAIEEMMDQILRI